MRAHACVHNTKCACVLFFYKIVCVCVSVYSRACMVCVCVCVSSHSWFQWNVPGSSITRNYIKDDKTDSNLYDTSHDKAEGVSPVDSDEVVAIGLKATLILPTDHRPLSGTVRSYNRYVCVLYRTVRPDQTRGL